MTTGLYHTSSPVPLAKPVKATHNSHFYFSSLENLDEHVRSLRQMQRILTYEMIWLTEGEGQLIMDLSKSKLARNTVYCFSPGQSRSIEFNAKATGYYMSLSPDMFNITAEHSSPFLLHQYKNINMPFQIIINNDIRNEMETILIHIKNEFIHHRLLRTEILKGLFRIFILYLSRNFIAEDQTFAQSKDVTLVNRFMMLVSQNFVSKKMVTDYASELCVTRGYLNQVVKKVSGFTASYFIQHFVLSEAKKQALHSDQSMKEIAYQLGFDDTAHFSKFFKINCGINFTNFKKGFSLHQ
jgi:AraC family transcriptional activator of pobA